MAQVLKVLPVAVLAVVPSAALAWWSINHHEVVPISKGVFAVLNENSSGAADYWCAAGDYTRRQLRIPSAQKIYIWRGIGPSETHPGKKSVQFSLTPPEKSDPSPGYSLSVKAVGDSLTSAAAYQYCLGDGLYDPFRPRGF